VVSPSSEERDYLKKTLAYLSAGVKEYWIVDPERGHVTVYLKPDAETPFELYFYGLGEPIPVRLFPGFSIDLSKRQAQAGP